MREKLIKYIFIILLVLCFIVPGFLFVSCARVMYKDNTPSVKCNLVIMLIKLKSLKGNEVFEIGRYLDKCYDDLDNIKDKK